MSSSIKTMDDFTEVLELSQQSPVLLMKFSPICPTSLQVQMEFEAFAPKAPQSLSMFTIDVIAARPTSRSIADTVGVQHESPQAIFIVKGQVAWHASHYRLTRESLQKKAQELC